MEKFKVFTKKIAFLPIKVKTKKNTLHDRIMDALIQMELSHICPTDKNFLFFSRSQCLNS